MNNFDLDFRNNGDFLKELLDKMPTVVPFLGAGTSHAYGYPLWPDFISKIINVIENGYSSADYEDSNVINNAINNAKELLAEKNFLGAADSIERAVGRLNTYVQHLVLRIAKNEAQKADLGYMVDKQDTGLWGNYLNKFPSRKYLTLNYDSVVENVLKANLDLKNENGSIAIRTPLDFTQPSGQKLRENEFMVYHLHGVYDKPDTLIFSTANYDEFYGKISAKHKRARGFSKELDSLNRDYSFLFIGCRLNGIQDRIYDTLCRINTPAEQFHYAFLNRNEVGESNWNRKEDELMRSNIKVLWYSAEPGNGDEYQQAIKELCGELFPEKIEEIISGQEIIPEQFETRGPAVKIPLKYYRGDNYMFYTVVKDGVFYLTDRGETYERLDKVLELKEPDVQKILHAVINQEQYKENRLVVVKSGKEEKHRWIMIRLENTISDGRFDAEKEKAKYVLVSCVAFMDAMRIFYV